MYDFMILAGPITVYLMFVGVVIGLNNCKPGKH